MKARFLSVVLGLVVLFSINSISYAKETGLPYKPGELLVRFAPTYDTEIAGKKKIRTDSEKIAILDSVSRGRGPMTIKRNFRVTPNLSVVKLPEGMSVEEALEIFKNKKGILYAEPDYKLEAYLTIPNDTLFDDQWSMHNTGQTGGQPGADINAPEAWDITTGSNEVIIAVIDTGVDYNHPDLAPNMWINTGEIPDNGTDDDDNGYMDDIYGYDACNDDSDPMDDCFHGTHVAGIIGAVGNNEIGVAGVSWNVKIMAVKFLDSWGSGWTSDAIDCIEYSIMMDAHVINASWGGGGYSQSLKDVIELAGNAGILFVAAAGNPQSFENPNNDEEPRYPASYDCENIISVMSTDHNDERSIWPTTHRSSAYGPTTVDLGAPGSDILSTFPTYITTGMVLSGFENTYYETIGGTSMAAPHVAGAYALLWAKNPTLTNIHVKNILLQSVDTIPALEGLCVSEGRLNLSNALSISQAWYVDDDAPTGGDGQSWETAFKYLQDALNNPQFQADDGIMVAQGTYKPDQDENNPYGTGNRSATFQLINGVVINGGYAGIGAANPNERNIESYQTILSGDLLGNDLPDFVNYNDNSYHVVTGSGTDAPTTIDGFIIERGFGNDSVSNPTPEEPWWTNGGGGMRNVLASPLVKNCTFRYNKADRVGGAIANISSSTEITNCTFIENRVKRLWGTSRVGGGAIYNYVSTTTKIKNCSFIDNYAKYWGGAIGNEGCEASEITNCIFSNNTSRYGGAIANGGNSSMEITNCVVAGNTATQDGGGLSNWHSSVVVTNCTFTHNHANYRGGGVFNLGDEESSASLKNSIIWDNTDNYSGNDEVKSAFNTNPVHISYCNIKNSSSSWGDIYFGIDDGGNIDADPLFLDIDNAAGPDGSFLTSDDGLQLTLQSPCIDVANDDTAPTADILGEERVDIPEIGFSISDMGTYEFTGVGIIWYVDADSSSYIRNGRSWETAFKYLQDALNNPQLQAGNRILAAQGTYKPDQDENNPYGTGDRSATFQLINGVVIKGGYAGIGAAIPNERNIESYQTILSGDIGTVGIDTDNSYHVVTGDGTDTTAILDGFTITGGNTIPPTGGGGMHNEYGSPTVTNCIFTSNFSQTFGGGVYNFESCPTFTNCVFENNAAYSDGGGIHNYMYSSPIFTNCIFSENATESRGGAMYNKQNSSPIIKNSVFCDNIGPHGSAIGNQTSSSPQITNCTLANNYSSYNHGAIFDDRCSSTITNCILWDLGSPEIYNVVSTTVVTYSDIKGGYTGEGNIDIDPLFVDADHPLFHGLLLSESSPCINAANDDVAPPNDILGRERVDADMGAYEYITPTIWYVDDTAPLDGDGTSWSTAFRYLQDALNNPEFIHYCDEIWAARGTYKPDQDENNPNGTGDRTATFQLVSGAVIKGGYAGIGAPDPNARNIKSYQTTLSGDIGIIGDTDDNSYHVVTSSNANPTAVLDGFTITKGRAWTGPRPEWEDERARGGGMYNNNSSPTVTNCTFRDNFAFAGGGMRNNNSSPTITNCIFRNNSAYAGAGGVYNIESSPQFTNCVFAESTSDYGGGAAINLDSSPKFTNCVFSDNAAMYGSGMRNSSSSPEIINCSFSGNYGWDYYAVIHNSNSSPIITNCILWDDVYGENPQEIYNTTEASNPIVTYCDIKGGYTGEGNIDADPLFVDAGSDNFHIDIHSPCVNRGDPCGYYDGQADIDGEARVMGSYVDMGADEVNVPVSDGHQWGLDERSGTVAYDSVGNSDGTFSSSDPCWVDGLIGGAVDFEGVPDYFSVSALDGAYDENSIFTVAGWFKTEQSTGKQTIVGQWSQGGTGTECWGWQVLVENNKVIARFGYELIITDVIGTSVVNDGYWHQFVMVRNGLNGVDLYVDGQPQGTGGEIHFYIYDTKFRIGDGSDGSGYMRGGPFNGIIDEVMIFDRVLSDEEVERLYQDGL